MQSDTNEEKKGRKIQHKKKKEMDRKKANKYAMEKKKE